MKTLILFFLMFTYACNGEASKESSPYSLPTSDEMTAIEHLKKAREILRNEEGHLMVMGRAHSEAEKKRYGTLVTAGKVLADLIDGLTLDE